MIEWSFDFPIDGEMKVTLNGRTLTGHKLKKFLELHDQLNEAEAVITKARQKFNEGVAELLKVNKKKKVLKRR